MSAPCVVEVIRRPCGHGKTLEVARLAAISAMAGRAVIYVAPTLALLEQFRNLLLDEGLGADKIRLAVGKRLGLNCRNPEVFALPMLGHGQEKYCEQVCPHRSYCPYWGAREMLESLSPPAGMVVLTTYSFLMHLRGRLWAGRWPAVVIYDEMPSFPLDLSEVVEDIDDAMSVIAVMKSRHEANGIVREKVIGKWGIQRLVTGEETYLLSATPSIGILRRMFPECEVRVSGDSFALDQVVRWHYLILNHSRSWVPEYGGCGFKANTAPGYPYFRASMGLGQWRGVPLRVFGSFSPPWEIHAVLAAMLRGRLRFIDITTDLDTPVKHPLTGMEVRVTWDGVLAIESQEGVIPVPLEVVFADIAQLLGRSGVGVENTYHGSIPLRARNHHFTINGVRGLILAGWSEHDLAIAGVRHAIGATTRSGRTSVTMVLRFLDSVFPHIYRHYTADSVASIVKHYVEILDRLNGQIQAFEVIERDGGQHAVARAEEEEGEYSIPF